MVSPSPSLEIRSPTREEIPAVAALGARLVRFHHGLDPERFLRVEPLEEGYRRYFEGHRGEPDTVVLAALIEGAVVGYAYGRVAARDWDMLRDRCGLWSDLYVDERWRGRGIARALSVALLEALSARGVPRVVLYAAVGNEAARRLFESLGFRATLLEMTRESEPPRPAGKP